MEKIYRYRKVIGIYTTHCPVKPYYSLSERDDYSHFVEGPIWT